MRFKIHLLDVVDNFNDLGIIRDGAIIIHLLEKNEVKNQMSSMLFLDTLSAHIGSNRTAFM